MVFLNVSGGAGNQFSQYAFARMLIHKRGDIDEFLINDGRVYRTTFNDFVDNHLKWFELYDIRYSAKPKKWLLLRMMCRIFRKLYSKGSLKYAKSHLWLAKKGVYSLDGIDYTDIVSDSKDIFVEGLYENPRYYDSIRPILLNEFTLKPQFDISDKELLHLIENNKTICVSALKHPAGEITERRPQQSIEWYKKAIEIICDKIDSKDLKIIFFSNDTEWIKDIKIDCCEVYYEKPGYTVYEKLMLMCRCTHFVLSNSTFSFWAQYLSPYDDKIVVSPYCPDLGFFQYLTAPGSVKQENYILLDVKTSEVVAQ